jgi:hypothetical protein
MSKDEKVATFADKVFTEVRSHVAPAGRCLLVAAQLRSLGLSCARACLHRQRASYRRAPFSRKRIFIFLKNRLDDHSLRR